MRPELAHNVNNADNCITNMSASRQHPLHADVSCTYIQGQTEHCISASMLPFDVTMPQCQGMVCELETMPGDAMQPQASEGLSTTAMPSS